MIHGNVGQPGANADLTRHDLAAALSLGLDQTDGRPIDGTAQILCDGKTHQCSQIVFQRLYRHHRAYSRCMNR